MANLILLIGLPGSGKSFLAEKLLNQCPQRRLISTDAIRAQLFGNEAVQGSWLLVWQDVRRQFQQTVLEIAQGQIQDAIYDATNAVRRQRREAIALARSTGFTTITGLWLDTPLSVCLKRNQQRDRQVPEDVIERMYRRLMGAPPRLSDGFNCLIRYSSFPERDRSTPFHPLNRP